MRRREFIALVGGASLACRSRARAQQPPRRTLRLGVLEPGAPPDPLLEAMRARLGELGYGEGRDLVLEVRWAEGNLARLPELALELASLKVDVFHAFSTPAVIAAQKATTTIPIVFSAVGDPPESLARPTGKCNRRLIACHRVGRQAARNAQGDCAQLQA
jgi:putative ABC transport system substrate-binding protein